MTVQEAARELGVSERQAYRDLKRGEDNVAAMLWSRWSEKAVPDGVQAVQLSSIESEVAGVELRRTPTELEALLTHSVKSIERLANGRGVHIYPGKHLPVVTLSTDPSLSVQVLTKVLSYAIQNTSGRRIEVMAEQQDDVVAIRVRYQVDQGQGKDLREDQVVVQLADRLGWSILHQVDSEFEHTITLQMSLHGPTVLIVDDNRGLTDLLDRFLTGHACKVMAANNGREGLELAMLLRPQAIILDVMMPDIDGWEVLQRLRAHPDTAEIPVIICSVFDDPELAYSLGASRFVPKPTRRVAVLEALRDLGVV